MWGDFWNGEDLSVWSAAGIHRSNITEIDPSIVDPTFVDQGDGPQEATHRITSSSSESSVDSTHGLINTKNYAPNYTDMSLAFSFPYNESLNVGSRAFEAFVRPSPIVITGTPKSYSFDMRSCTFSLSLTPFQEDPPEDAPTEIFIPDYFFQDCEPEVSVSSGRWMVHRPSQVLRWWHSSLGDQTLRISSGYKRGGVVGTADDDVEGWYYWNGKCRIM